MKYFTLIFFSSCLFINVFAQETQGRLQLVVIDNEGEIGIDRVSVTLFDLADSAIVGFAFSDKKGGVVIPKVPFHKPLRILLTHVSYASYKYDFVFSDSLQTSGDTIRLYVQNTIMEMVEISWERHPIIFRGDTIEFDASAFLNRPGTVVEDLMRRLPGVNISENGITYNGKNVSKITLDGKDFFGDDPSILLKNIPSMAVNKVQITEEKTAFGKLNKKGNVSINLTLKKEAKKGHFGKAYAGYGSDERYESGALWNVFRDTFQISFIGFSNNLSQAGFSFTDLFKLGGFGRSGVRTVSSSNNGQYAINGINMGGGNGITQSSGAGFNLNHNPNNLTQLNLSYFYGNSNTNLLDLSNTVFSFLDSNIATTADNKSSFLTQNHSVNYKLNWSKDTLLFVYHTLYYSNANTSQLNNSLVNNVFSNSLLNNTLSNIQNDQEQLYDLNHHLYVRYKFRPTVTLFFYSSQSYANNVKKNVINQLVHSNTPLLLDENYLQELDRIKTFSRQEYEVGLEKQWNSALGSSIGFKYSPQSYKTPVRVFQTPDGSSQKTEIFGLSSDYNYLEESFTFTKSIEMELGDFEVYTDFFYENKFVYGTDLFRNLRRTNNRFSLLGLDMFVFIEDFKKWNGYASFSRTFDDIDFQSSHPFLNNINPRFRSLGNVNLAPEISHVMYFNLNRALPKNYRFVVYMNASQILNPAVHFLNFDELGREIQTIENRVELKINSYTANASFNKTIKLSQKWEMPIGFQYQIFSNSTFDFYANEQNKNDLIAYNYKPNLGLKKAEKLDFNINYNYTIQQSNNSLFGQTVNKFHSLNSDLWVALPRNYSFESVYKYNYQPFIGRNMINVFNMLHLSLNKKVFKNKSGSFKISVFDLLKQNTTITRNVTANRISESQLNNVTRYYMLSFVYNINSLKVSENDRIKKNNEFIFF